MKIKSKAQRIRDAMTRAEENATSLLYAAELCNAGLPVSDAIHRRREVLRAARAYGRSMDRISKVRA